MTSVNDVLLYWVDNFCIFHSEWLAFYGVTFRHSGFIDGSSLLVCELSAEVQPARYWYIRELSKERLAFLIVTYLVKFLQIPYWYPTKLNSDQNKTRNTFKAVFVSLIYPGNGSLCMI